MDPRGGRGPAGERVSHGETQHVCRELSTERTSKRPITMNKNQPTNEASTSMTDLSAVSTGTMIRLNTKQVTLERVEHLGVVHNALSPVDGQNLTRITFREHGRVKRRIFPSFLS